MARICIIRHGYFPWDPRVYRDARALVAAGHELDVICLRKEGELPRERLEGINIRRLPVSHQRRGVKRYLFEYAAFAFLAGALVSARHIRRPYQIVQTHNVPDALVFSALVPKLLGARVILDLHEPFPELAVAKFGIHPGGRAYRLIEREQVLSCRFADRLLTVTEAIKASVVARGIPADKITVFHVAADEDLFNPAKLPPELRRADPDVFRVVSHGALSRGRGLETLVRAVAVLKDELPDLRLELLGDGEIGAELKDLAQRLDAADRVSLPGHLPFEEMLERIATADVGVVPYERNPYSEMVLTNKMFEYFNMRRPVIISATQAVTEAFDEEDVSFFEPGNAADLARAIRDLHDHPARGRALVEHALRTQERLSWNRVERPAYLQLIAELVG
jgi:glycosyltransferase involved in cell wall biosynthesis